MKGKIYYGGQLIDNEDVKSVSSALRENLITTGRQVNKFEKKIKNKLNCRYAVSCSNATAGLHLAFMAINLNKNDVILMPAINFIASYSMAQKMGAKIYLVDVDPQTGQVNEATIKKCIKINKLKTIKAIVTMYLGGYIFDNIAIYKLKKKYNFFLIEDACHALGAKYTSNNKTYSIGSCRHSDLAIFSFHPVKSITTGEGGVIVTNSNFLYKKIKIFRSHGIIRNTKKYWEYDISNTSYNYRLSDINCALGVSQLKKLDFFISRRKSIYERYKKKIDKFKYAIRFIESKNKINGYHLAILNIDYKKLKTSKEKFIKFLNKNKIYPQFHYIPIYNFSINRNKYKSQLFIGSEEYYRNNISLPIHLKLTNNEIDYIVSKIKKFILVQA